MPSRSLLGTSIRAGQAALLYLCRRAVGLQEASRYCLPDAQLGALSNIFAVNVEAISGVAIKPDSEFAKMHGDVVATTRFNTIYLAGSGDEFAADHKLLLHEYFHVIRQWNTGELTVGRYVWELLRKGYWRNKYEIAARQFADDYVEAFRQALRR
ncbi:MAG TPA: hypothetical protein VFB45_16770 [Pseudolabrys sp.]|nr:hypothetical protein [Pseudolabrys sp.]